MEKDHRTLKIPFYKTFNIPNNVISEKVEKTASPEVKPGWKLNWGEELASFNSSPPFLSNLPTLLKEVLSVEEETSSTSSTNTTPINIITNPTPIISNT